MKKSDIRTKWLIDKSHCEIGFKVMHLMIAHVRGQFKEFDANIYTMGKDFSTVEINFWIDPASIATGDSQRDTHLKGPEFFDAKKYKEITFVSNTMARADSKGKSELWGELTIKGISKKIKLDVEFGGILKDPWGNEKAGFSISGNINRSDWDLNWNKTIESGGFMVGEEVKILCEVELISGGQKDLAMELEPTADKKGLEESV